MVSSNNSKKWIAVYTKPKHEKVVKKELLIKGYDVYLPLLKKRRRWSDRKKLVEFPLFKSYLFVHSKLNESIFILKTPGIVKLIKFGDKIAIVNNDVINSIKLMLNGGYNPIATDYFLKGDPVYVKDGPLKGLAGEVIRVDNVDRLIIRVEAIQHSLSIKIDRSYLSKHY